MVAYKSPNPTTRTFLHADERGSIVATTGSTGAVLAINRYDEYGIPASTNQGRYGYTGQLWIGEASMWYFRARIYSPYLGRFLQVDPIGYEDQMNLYAYVGNDPLSGRDPTGMNRDCRAMPHGGCGIAPGHTGLGSMYRGGVTVVGAGVVPRTRRERRHHRRRAPEAAER